MATGGRYLEGSPVRLSVEITVEGVKADPDTLDLLVGFPTGTVTYSYPDDITKDAVGEYHIDVDAPPVSAAIRVWYKFVSTGAGAGRSQAFFVVEPSRVD